MWGTFLMVLVGMTFSNGIRSDGAKAGSGMPTVHTFSSGSRPTKTKETMDKIETAIKTCTQAIASNPMNDNNLKGPSFCRAILRQSINDHDGALEDYKRALERNPKNGLAAFNAAEILENWMGREIEALSFYRTAMSIHDDMVEVSFNKIISLLLRTGDEKTAQNECDVMIKSGPSQMQYAAFEKLGTTLHKCGHFSQSLQSFQSAIAASKDPEMTTIASELRQLEALNNAAFAAAAALLPDLAESYFLDAIELNASHADTRTNYGVFLKDSHRQEQAIEQFQKAIALDPTNQCKETGYAVVQLASLTGGSLTTTSMSQEYVTSLFNGYAARFESELIGKLEYRGHEHVVEELAVALTHTPSSPSMPVMAATTSCTVVDCGCGTGLCGPLLRKLLPSCRLIGIDLAPRMLEIASKRLGCYDTLIQTDAAAYFSASEAVSSVDAIVAADVFIYVGDLTVVLEAMHQALKPNGVLVFTVEELLSELTTTAADDHLTIVSELPGQQCKGVKLLSVGRFGHTESYVKAQAAKGGFIIEASKRDKLRTQAGQDVPSITFSFRKQIMSNKV